MFKNFSYINLNYKIVFENSNYFLPKNIRFYVSKNDKIYLNFSKKIYNVFKMLACEFLYNLWEKLFGNFADFKFFCQNTQNYNPYSYCVIQNFHHYEIRWNCNKDDNIQNIRYIQITKQWQMLLQGKADGDL